MSKQPQEWFRQAEYDMETAEFIFGGGRYFYAVFMCHLSVEKALKGLFLKKFGELPPRTHNLIYLMERIGFEPPPGLSDWIFNLNRVSVPTRYPDDLQRMQKDFNRARTEELLEKSKEILKWLRTQL